MSDDAAGGAGPRDLSPVRTLADLLPCGVLLITADARLAVASPRACQLLGAADERALAARWQELRAAFDALHDGAQGFVDVNVAGESRRLRIDSHRVDGDGAQRLLLLEDPRGIDDGAGVLIAAGRAQAQQHVLAGILHDLNGRLNNLNLTLALLEGTLARHEPPAPVEPLLERCRRHGKSLTAEARRLGDALGPLAALVAGDAPADGGADLAKLLNDTRTALRHAAVLNEITLAVSAGDPPMRVRGDAAMLELALLDIVSGLMAATTAGGDIAMEARGNGAEVVLRVTARNARVSARTLRAFERIALTAPSDALDLLAARAIVASQGGTLTLQSDDRGALIEARFAREPPA